jgi:hypothetical protein
VSTFEAVNLLKDTSDGQITAEESEFLKKYYLLPKKIVTFVTTLLSKTTSTTKQNFTL